MPPPPPPAAEYSGESSPPSSSSFDASLLIIAAILAVVFLASAAIHLLIRYLSGSSSAASSPLTVAHCNAASSSSGDQRKLSISSLLSAYALSSARPSSAADCAVCLSPLAAADELRLLPGCRHAFHSPCIDTWLRSSNHSCPLCRSSVHLPAEAGAEAPPTSPPRPPARSDSVGSSIGRMAEEEVEAVVTSLRRAEEGVKVDDPPSPEAAEEVPAARGWLKEYVDRLASSSSLSYLRFPARGSCQYDGGGGGGEESRRNREVEPAGGASS